MLEERNCVLRETVPTQEARLLQQTLRRVEQAQVGVARAFHAMRGQMLETRYDEIKESSWPLHERMLVTTLKAHQRRAAVQQMHFWLGHVRRMQMLTIFHNLHANTRTLARRHRHRMEAPIRTCIILNATLSYVRGKPTLLTVLT